MNIEIQHEDLKLFLKVMRRHPHDINYGTQTAFISSYLYSAFTPPADETFKAWVQWFAYYYHGSKYCRNKRHASSELALLFDPNNPKVKRHYGNLDPLGFFDMEDGLSFSAMKVAIEFVCCLHKIPNEAQYYKSPYLLYAKYMNSTDIDDYIETIGVPTLLPYLKMREVKKEMVDAYFRKENYVLNFYPEKLLDMMSSYIYRKDLRLLKIIYEKYAPKSDNYQIIFK